ncbi:RES family NAD+ phosphorylase [Tardiphaga sp.]|uniref:RES family NAD+ phosphorylase n=1 Tax=Tardiphaga sp. TaxID=1926292 RepID=UPI00352B860C
MAKGKTISSKPCTPRTPSTPTSASPVAGAPVAAGGSAPRTISAPPTNLNTLVKRAAWATTAVIHRIHPDVYKAEQFNPGPIGNARFSPIFDATGTSIATIYGGTTFECAAMETVFHDVPFGAGLKTVAKRKLRKHHYSQVTPAIELILADLSNKALRKLGIPRGDLIDTEKDLYPQTRKWAEAIHAQCPDIHGLCWVSRQDDTERAIILFADRLPPAPLSSAAPSVDIVRDATTYAALVNLADDIGVKVTGK